MSLSFYNIAMIANAAFQGSTCDDYCVHGTYGDYAARQMERELQAMGI